jgi:hypothetical protein
VVALVLWTRHPPGWFAVAAAAAGWVLGLFVTFRLDRSFRRASGT